MGNDWKQGDNTLGASVVAALLNGYTLSSIAHRMKPLQGTEWERMILTLGKVPNEERRDVLEALVMEYPFERVKLDPLRGIDALQRLIDLHGQPEMLSKFIGADKLIMRREQRERVTSSEVIDMFDDVQWVWRDWFPRGFLSMIAGRPGVGKSAIMLDLVAQSLTTERGQYWPDRAHRITPPERRRVLWLDCEQTHQLLFSRMRKWRLDPDPFFWPVDLDDKDNKFPRVKLDQPRWLEYIADLIFDERPQWVVVDSLRSSFTGDENSSEAQGFLDAMAAVARNTNAVVTFVHHLRKASQNEQLNVVHPDRVRGSSGILAAFRSVVAVDQPDPNDEHLRLHVIKANLCKPPEPLGLLLDEDGRPQWTTDAPASPRQETAADRALEFLRRFLHDGPRAVADVLEEAEAEGHSRRAVYDAKRIHGVEHYRTGFGKDGRNMWRLPE